MTYAASTDVPVEKTRIEIERLIAKFDGDRFALMTSAAQAMIVFEARGRRLKFDLPLPPGPERPTERNNRTHAQSIRAKWRALLLCTKAKLEAVESGIETFEEAFLSHVVMPDGKTVHEHSAAAIEAAYKTGTMQPLLPPPAPLPGKGKP